MGVHHLSEEAGFLYVAFTRNQIESMKNLTLLFLNLTAKIMYMKFNPLKINFILKSSLTKMVILANTLYILFLSCDK